MENPFRPTFGAPPLFWVGRGIVLDSFRTALDGSAGNASRSMVLSGARGIGKTVLINELEDIAAALHLAPGTVRNHISNAIGKLGVRTRQEAERAAWEAGWI